MFPRKKIRREEEEEEAEAECKGELVLRKKLVVKTHTNATRNAKYEHFSQEEVRCETQDECEEEEEEEEECET